MDKKTLLGNWKQNIGIIIGAAVVALWTFYIVNNPNAFMTSVLSLQETTFIAEKWRDIAYKTNSWYIDVFMSEKLETPKTIDLTISFDKNSITIDTKNLSGQWTRSIDTPDEETIVVHTNPQSNIDKNQSMILIPFTGNYKQILVSEAVAISNNNIRKNLSIWLLNETTSHSN
jgi:hypothetical protein